MLLILFDTISWLLVATNFIVLIACLYYVRIMRKQFNDASNKLSEKLSDRSYNVMIQKWELERKNHSISEQNQEILESLQYAKNIQSAILPKEDVICSLFKDGFVYYRPKDIVSGDFYFLEKNDDLIFVAVADCTGHGVAGAFMSMMGSALLKQIIMLHKTIDPSLILNELNEGIVESLRQKEVASHGGMDIVICVVDIKKQKIEFAGANRPLIYIRNRELETLRPDKLPIGGFTPDENRRFTKQELKIQTGDRIYLSTDGYADQFGGPDGKKIMTKKFKELLVNIHELPMKTQRQTLDTYFENWRGKLEQVDDVLVIGFDF